MAQYPINPIEASKQPNGPISTTPIKVVQIQTLGPRQFSAGRPDPTPQRHASVGCVFRRACATATAPLPPQSRLASVHHPSAISHTFLPWRHPPCVRATPSLPFRCEAAFHRATPDAPLFRHGAAVHRATPSPVAGRRGCVLPRSYLPPRCCAAWNHPTQQRRRSSLFSGKKM